MSRMGLFFKEPVTEWIMPLRQTVSIAYDPQRGLDLLGHVLVEGTPHGPPA